MVGGPSKQALANAPPLDRGMNGHLPQMQAICCNFAIEECNGLAGIIFGDEGKALLSPQCDQLKMSLFGLDIIIGNPCQIRQAAENLSGAVLNGRQAGDIMCSGMSDQEHDDTAKKKKPGLEPPLAGSVQSACRLGIACGGCGAWHG